MMAAGNEWNVEIKADARDALPFERIGPNAEKRRRWPRLALWGGLIVLVAGSGIAAFVKYGDATAGRTGEVPVVHAEVDPIKVRPQEPGGMEVPNRDKLIYDQMSGNASAPRVERLLPPPETPRALPAPTPAAAVPVPTEVPVVPTAEVPTERDVAGIAPPAAQPAPKPLAATGPAAMTAPAVPGTAGTGFRVQIAAARTAEQAEQEWVRLSRQHKDLLGELGHAVAATDLGDKGIFHRLRAGPVKDRAAAEDLCGKLKQRNVGCMIVRPE